MKLQRTAVHVSPAMAATKAKLAPSAARKAAGAPATKAKGVPSHNGEDRLEKIRQQAYFLFTARNGADGGDLDDWLRAEAMVDQLLTQSVPAGQPMA